MWKQWEIPAEEEAALVHNYIGQHPIQERAEIRKSTTAFIDKNVLWLNLGDL
jgi:hypothetical protein